MLVLIINHFLCLYFASQRKENDCFIRKLTADSKLHSWTQTHSARIRTCVQETVRIQGKSTNVEKVFFNTKKEIGVLVLERDAADENH